MRRLLSLCAVIPFIAAACGGDAASEVETWLEEQGFAVARCQKAAEDRFLCHSDPTREAHFAHPLNVLVIDGKFWIARPV